MVPEKFGDPSYLMVKSLEVLIATTICVCQKNDAGIPCALDLSWKFDADGNGGGEKW